MPTGISKGCSRANGCPSGRQLFLTRERRIDTRGKNRQSGGAARDHQPRARIVAEMLGSIERKDTTRSAHTERQIKPEVQRPVKSQKNSLQSSSNTNTTYFSWPPMKTQPRDLNGVNPAEMNPKGWLLRGC
jgi:hypothetical protein